MDALTHEAPDRDSEPPVDTSECLHEDTVLIDYVHNSEGESRSRERCTNCGQTIILET